MNRPPFDFTAFLSDLGTGASTGSTGLDLAEEIRDLVFAGRTADGLGMVFGRLRSALGRATAPGFPDAPSSRRAVEEILDIVEFLRGAIDPDTSSPFGPALKRFYDRLRRHTADAVRDRDPAGLAAIESSVEKLLSRPLVRPFLASSAEASTLDREAVAAFLIAIRNDASVSRESPHAVH